MGNQDNYLLEENEKLKAELKDMRSKFIERTKSEPMVNAPTHLKEHHRHFLRLYFTNVGLDATNYIYQEVILLLNSPEINNLRDTLGKEKYNKLVRYANKFSSIYRGMGLNIEIIIKLQAKTESDIVKEKIKELQREVLRLSKLMPAVNIAIWKLYYLLVNRSNLANLPVPRDGRATTHAQKTIGAGRGGYL